jgi:hypothetical protein
MIEDGIDVVAGNEANRTIKERASSRSRSESVKVGYLRKKKVRIRLYDRAKEVCAPLFDDMINPVSWFRFLQVLC